MVLPLLLACAAAPPPTPEPEPWAFIFLVPYDNDLSPFAAPVREAIRAGTAGGVPAFLLEDLPDSSTLWACRDGVCTATPAPDLEDSSSPASLRALLDWAGERAEARRWGVVILDHGGAQRELARDDHPGPGRAPSWLDVASVADALVAFDATVPGEVELLFAQVCSKAALEPLYTLSRGARTLVASQLPLAAPNTWYASVLPELARHPDWEGPQVAEAIASADGPAMYAAYACFHRDGLQALPARLARLGGGASLDALAPGVYGYAGEGYVDLGLLLDALGADRAILEPALCGHWRNPSPPEALTLGFPDPARLSGISVALSPDPTLSVHRVPGYSAWVSAALAP